MLSTIIGLISVLVTSSYAAVNPAGPAPIIIAVLLIVIAFVKEDYFSSKEVPKVNEECCYYF